MATVVAVRHGETTWNRDGRVQGWADTSLTERGRRQARRTGVHLADAYDVDHLVVSDLSRTRETAAAFAERGLAVEPAPDRAWRERSFGDYQGLTRTELADRLEGDDAGESLLCAPAAPGGESLTTLRERVTGGFERLRGRLDDGETAVVVTHGGPIRVLLSVVTGRSLTEVARETTPHNCGLTVVDATGDPALVSADDATHLVEE